jgi:hypothetical protein
VVAAKKHMTLFPGANGHGTSQPALDRDAHPIQGGAQGQRTSRRFVFEAWRAAEPEIEHTDDEGGRASNKLFILNACLIIRLLEACRRYSPPVKSGDAIPHGGLRSPRFSLVTQYTFIWRLNRYGISIQPFARPVLQAS